MKLVVEDTVPLEVEKEALPLVEGAGPLQHGDGTVPPGVESTEVLDHMVKVDTMVELKPPITKMMILVEPRQDEAPVKRRRGKGRRRLDGLIQGTLHQFSFNPIITKECTIAETIMVEPKPVRKRKQDTLVEDPSKSYGKRSRRTMIEFDDFSDKTLGGPGIVLGAKSFYGGETNCKPLMGTTGINWGIQIKNEEIQTPGGIGKKTRNQINTQ